MAWLKQDSTAEWEMKETKRVSKFILRKKMTIIWKIHSGFLINSGVHFFVFKTEVHPHTLGWSNICHLETLSFLYRLQQWVNDFPRQDI